MTANIAVNTTFEVFFMKYENNKNKYYKTRVFIKSAIWTLAALSLIAIGYLGASFLAGV